MAIKIDHISMVVENAEDAIAWFGKYLGFGKLLVKAPMKANGGAGMRYTVGNDDGDILEFMEYEEKKEVKTGIIQHIGFKVDSVDECYDLLSKDGQIMNGETIRDMGKAKILYFSGIFGIELELIEMVKQ